MSKGKGSGNATMFAAWKRAPATWAIYHAGRLLNRTGWGLEKAGAQVMAWARERLRRLAKKEGL